MSNPLMQSPTLVSKKELWFTFIGIAGLLIFIAIVVSLTLAKSGPPAVEVYQFPQNTYTCTNDYTNGKLEHVCAFDSRSPVPTEAAVTTTP